jgi:ComF family protein
VYDQYSSASVFAFKYGENREFAVFYAQMLLHFYGDWMKSLDIELIIPVPVSKMKQRKKGFNHAGLLAEKIGEELGIPVSGRALVRIHSTAPQKELGKEERRKNLEKAFRADIKYLPGIQRVLLVDDIYTTGSTIEFCTRALKAAGVKKVWFLTLCIGNAF